jgi:hypothetical protein
MMASNAGSVMIRLPAASDRKVTPLSLSCSGFAAGSTVRTTMCHGRTVVRVATMDVRANGPVRGSGVRARSGGRSMSAWCSWDSIRPLRWSKEAGLPATVLHRRSADPARRARLMVRRRWISYRAAHLNGSIGTMDRLRSADAVRRPRPAIRRRWMSCRVARRSGSIGIMANRLLQRRPDGPARPLHQHLIVGRRWIYRAARQSGMIDIRPGQRRPAPPPDWLCRRHRAATWLWCATTRPYSAATLPMSPGPR